MGLVAAVEGGGGGIWEMEDLDLEDCTENCAHLYFFDKDGTRIVGVAGTAKNFHEAPNRKHRSGIKKVAAVQQTGVDCHKIFSGKGFRGRSKEIKGQNKIVLLLASLIYLGVKAYQRRAANAQSV